jgi:hypothetical protein
MTHLVRLQRRAEHPGLLVRLQRRAEHPGLLVRLQRRAEHPGLLVRLQRRAEVVASHRQQQRMINIAGNLWMQTHVLALITLVETTMAILRFDLNKFLARNP